VALVSGALSAAAFDMKQIWYLSPGVVFGILVGGALFFLRQSSVARSIYFAIATLASWYAAFYFAIYAYDNFWNFIPADAGRLTASGVIAGMLGAALLGGAAAGLFPWFRSWRRILVITVICGVPGALLGIDWGERYPMFIAWQGAFALGLALAFPAQTEKSAV
jgi:hypothetical protein